MHARKKIRNPFEAGHFVLTLSQTIPGFYVSGTTLLKTQWEKEKLLVTSNFSFSHSVFYPFGGLIGVFNSISVLSQRQFTLFMSFKAGALKCLAQQKFTRGEIFTILSSLKLSSANTLTLQQSKYCCLGKGYKTNSLLIK